MHRVYTKASPIFLLFQKTALLCGILISVVALCSENARAETVHYYGHILSERIDGPHFQVVLIEAELPQTSDRNAEIKIYPLKDVANTIVIERETSSKPAIIVNGYSNEKIIVDRNSTQGNENGNVDVSASYLRDGSSFSLDVVANRERFKASGKTSFKGTVKTESFVIEAEPIISTLFLKKKVLYKGKPTVTKYFADEATVKNESFQELKLVSVVFARFEPTILIDLQRKRILGITPGGQTKAEVLHGGYSESMNDFGVIKKSVGDATFSKNNPLFANIHQLLDFTFTPKKDDGGHYFPFSISKQDASLTIIQGKNGQQTFTKKSKVYADFVASAVHYFPSHINVQDAKFTYYSGISIIDHKKDPSKSGAKPTNLVFIRVEKGNTIHFMLFIEEQYNLLSFERAGNSGDYRLVYPKNYSGKLVREGDSVNKILAINYDRTRFLRADLKLDGKFTEGKLVSLGKNKEPLGTIDINLIKQDLKTGTRILKAIKDKRKNYEQLYSGEFTGKIESGDKTVWGASLLRIFSKNINTIELNFGNKYLKDIRIDYLDSTNRYQVTFKDEKNNKIDCEADVAPTSLFGIYDTSDLNMDISAKCIYSGDGVVKKRLVQINLKENEIVYKQINYEAKEAESADEDLEYNNTGTLVMKFNRIGETKRK